MAREYLCGALALGLAVIYFVAAAALPHSLLSDDVGADGVPRAIAVALGVLGLAQLVRAAGQRRAAGPDELASGGAAAHLRAFGVIVIGIAYLALAPVLGYPLAIAVLVFTMAVYAGLPVSLELVAISVGGALALWAMFAKLLGVAMPFGPFGRLFS